MIKTVAELQKIVKETKKAGKSIGLVPAMSALHEGHASLIKAAHAENDFTVVSDFVNPTQFGPTEDLDAYGDYCYSDYTDALSTISVPVLVLSADSGIFPNSIEQGKWIVAQIPQSEFVPFYKGGHMLFWVEADKFNRAVADFREKIS